MSEIRHNWTTQEILELYHIPLLDLVYRAAAVHRNYHNPREVQVSALLSVKTGNCPEDCAYCPQSVHYHTDVKAHRLLPLEDVKAVARKAKEAGASRMCLGAAWKEAKDNNDFDRVLEMVSAINGMGMEVCCTLGMLTDVQAQKLADAGLYAYNHNLDTSEANYKTIITTRAFADRLNTLENVRKANITVCSGGIIGMGESVEDRVEMLRTLSSMNPHPESVPVNALVPVEGTPLEGMETVSIWEMLRMIATARIVMPGSVVRLSAGRAAMSKEGQALCFMAGANSIFAGDKLLTTPNSDFEEDLEMFKILGLVTKPAPEKENRQTAKFSEEVEA